MTRQRILTVSLVTMLLCTWETSLSLSAHPIIRLKWSKMNIQCARKLRSKAIYKPLFNQLRSRTKRAQRKFEGTFSKNFKFLSGNLFYIFFDKIFLPKAKRNFPDHFETCNFFSFSYWMTFMLEIYFKHLAYTSH